MHNSDWRLFRYLNTRSVILTAAAASVIGGNENIENWKVKRIYWWKITIYQCSVTNVCREKFTKLITDSCVRLYFSWRALFTSIICITNHVLLSLVYNVFGPFLQYCSLPGCIVSLWLVVVGTFYFHYIYSIYLLVHVFLSYPFITI